MSPWQIVQHSREIMIIAGVRYADSYLVLSINLAKLINHVLSSQVSCGCNRANLNCHETCVGRPATKLTLKRIQPNHFSGLSNSTMVKTTVWPLWWSTTRSNQRWMQWSNIGVNSGDLRRRWKAKKVARVRWLLSANEVRINFSAMASWFVDHSWNHELNLQNAGLDFPNVVGNPDFFPRMLH